MIIVSVTMPEIDVLIGQPTVDGFWMMIGRIHTAPWRATVAPRTAWKVELPPKPEEYR